MNCPRLYLDVPHLRLYEDMEEVLGAFPLTDDGGHVLQQTGRPAGERRDHCEIVLRLQQLVQITPSSTAIADQPELSANTEDRTGPQTHYRVAGRHFITERVLCSNVVYCIVVLYNVYITLYCRQLYEK